MEWSKTKSIMIAALVITNLIIGYFYWQENLMRIGLPDQKQVQLLSDQLLGVGVDVSKITPLETMPIPKINLTLRKFDLSRIDSNIYKVSEKEDGVIILSMKRPVLPKVADMSDTEEVVSATNQWLEENFGNASDYMVSNIIKTDKGFLISYTQQFNAFFVEGSYITIEYVNDSIVRFESRWYDIEELRSQSLKICSYPVALYRLLDGVASSDNQKNQVFNKIEVGYRLESNAFDTDIASGEASPYFRFSGDGESSLLVEALWGQ